MSAYHGHAVSTVEGEIVLLKFVESIRIRDAEDLVVDKLKGDVAILIRTISGKEHIVSMKQLHIAIGGGTVVGEDLAMSLIEKWNWINKPEIK